MGVVQAPVGVLAPHQVAQPIAVVEEPGLEHLLVEPRPVKARREGQLNVLNQVLLGGGGVDAVGIEALVQHHPLEQGLAVYQELLPLEAGVPQAEVAVHPVLPKGELQGVKAALAGLPQVGFLQLQLGGEEAVLYPQGLLPHRAALPGGGEGQLPFALDSAGDSHPAVFQVGVILGVLDVALGHELQPHRLPNARGAGVIAAGRGVQVGLLALGLQAGADVVPHCHKEAVLPQARLPGDVQGKGGVPALVGARQLPVDVDRGLVIHRAEVQQHLAGQLLLAQGEGAAVGHAADKVCVANAGELAFRAEGHQNLPVEGLLLPQTALHSAAAKVERKLPGAV